MVEEQTQGEEVHTDFLISYTRADQAWAEWIAATLEAAGYQTHLAAWDVRPGANVVLMMDQATRQADRMVLVLSAAFLEATDTFGEWAVAFGHDPTGKDGCVLPVRIEPCTIQGLLGSLAFIDLVKVNEPEARVRLLEGVKRERAKPPTVPFPNSSSSPAPQDRAIFPGTTSPSKRAHAREEQKMQQVTVLFLAANPTSTSRLAIDEEMRAIAQKVRTSEHRDALVFASAWAVRPDDLLQLLNQHRPQIVHFSGHGSGQGLSLAREQGQAQQVPTRALQTLFRTLKDNIRLVFLNACYSREQAQALVETIDCVIGMKESIHNDAAAAFASSFYRALGFGRSIQEAFDQGIASLLLEGTADEEIPELLVKPGVDAQTIHLIAPALPS